MKQSLAFNYSSACSEVQLEAVTLTGFKFEWTGSMSSFVIWLKLHELPMVDILKLSHAYLFKECSRESK